MKKHIFFLDVHKTDEQDFFVEMLATPARVAWFGRDGQFPDAVFVLQGLICYKPSEQDGCFLREMDQSDYDNVHALLRESPQKVLAR